MVKRLLQTFLVLAWLASQSSAIQPLHHLVLTFENATQIEAANGTGRFEGVWLAHLDIGATKWPMMLRIAKNKEGVMFATLDAPDADRLQADSIEQTGNKLKLVLTSIGASFQGDINAKSSEIIGVWKQGRTSLPLVFENSGRSGGVIGGIIRSLPGRPQDQSKALPAESAGFQDEASFSFLVNDKPMGVVKSSWASDGSFESRSTVTISGQTTQITTKIIPDQQGRWAKIIADTPLTTIIVTREGSKIIRTIGKNAVSWESKNNALLLDNNSPALLSQALRMYDRSKGGLQQFPLLEIPPRYFPQWLMVQAKETTEQTVGDNHLSLTRFYCSAEEELDIWADATGKIYLLEWPAEHIVFVRNGYESLHPGKASSAN